MAKKRSWFSFLKRLFVSSHAKSKTEKKPNKWRWGFGRHKSKQLLATEDEKTLSEAREEQRKLALTVAIATETAAKAAVAAAHAAAEVVRLTGAWGSCERCPEEKQNLAANKIQAAFRAHLARKALRALKGLVRLQAVVRGRAVRRQVFTTFKGLSPITNIKPHGHSSKVSTVEVSSIDGEEKQLLGSKEELIGEKDVKLKYCKSQGSWDHNMLKKEDLEAIGLRKHDAIFKRDRMKKYSFSYQERRNAILMPEERLVIKGNGKQQSWFDRWTCERDQMEKSKSSAYSNVPADDICGSLQLRLTSMQKQDSLGLNLPCSIPRRSFSHSKQNSIGEDGFFENPYVFPTYMAATESTKAKARSMSTPRQRLGFFDTCIDLSSPGKNRVPFWSTYNGGSISTDGKGCFSQKISIGTKHLH